MIKKKDCVSVDIIQILKKKGYSINKNNSFREETNIYNDGWKIEYIYYPLLYEVKDWLRENYSIYIKIQELPYNIPEFGVTWTYSIIFLTSMKDYTSKSVLYINCPEFKTYEEALNEGIKEALKLI